MLNRVETLERELEQLRRRVDELTKDKAEPWWKRVAGMFADDPEFEEAMRLGREYRDSLRPEDE